MSLPGFVRGLLDLLYPPRCEACGRLGAGPLCEECRARVEFVRPPLCEVCGEPFDPLARGGPTCARCRTGKRHFRCARSAVYYTGPAAAAIQRFKYEGQLVLGGVLGELMVQALGEGARAIAEVEVDVVCPVPLHPLRLRERGFNQAEVLAEAVAAAFGRPVRTLLERTRPTVPQVDLPAEERASNVRGAFAARTKERIAGQRVVLVDDLFTTGATLAECVRALRRAGAAEVSVFTLARPAPLWRRPALETRQAAEEG